MTNKKASFLNFNLISTKSTKTQCWQISPRLGGQPLGYVKWHSPWRKYCFYTHADWPCVFDAGCLFELEEFLTNQTQIHNNNLKNSKNNSSEN